MPSFYLLVDPDSYFRLPWNFYEASRFILLRPYRMDASGGLTGDFCLILWRAMICAAVQIWGKELWSVEEVAEGLQAERRLRTRSSSHEQEVWLVQW